MIQHLSMTFNELSAFSGCLSHDFIVGRELNPRIGSFDIKMFFIKTMSITLVLIAWAFVVESYEQKNQLTNMPLLLTAVLTTMYSLDFIVFEVSCTCV